MTIKNCISKWNDQKCYPSSRHRYSIMHKRKDKRKNRQNKKQWNWEFTIVCTVNNRLCHSTFVWLLWQLDIFQCLYYYYVLDVFFSLCSFPCCRCALFSIYYCRLLNGSLCVAFSFVFVMSVNGSSLLKLEMEYCEYYDGHFLNFPFVLHSPNDRCRFIIVFFFSRIRCPLIYILFAYSQKGA